jgi:hypothetical protein
MNKIYWPKHNKQNEKRREKEKKNVWSAKICGEESFGWQMKNIFPENKKITFRCWST